MCTPPAIILCYAILSLQRVLADFSFLAKPYQPNGYHDQMALISPLVGYKSNTLTTYVHLWHGPYHDPTYADNHNHDQSLNSHGLSSHVPDLKPQL